MMLRTALSILTTSFTEGKGPQHRDRSLGRRWRARFRRRVLFGGLLAEGPGMALGMFVNTIASVLVSAGLSG
ncbi:MAG: hypothetical protein ACR2ND_14335 [Solirubrobacteraceae bacterium]